MPVFFIHVRGEKALKTKNPRKREDARYTKYLACYEKVICKPVNG
jgi:hypothetical protein